MSGTPTLVPDSAFESQLREVNAALLVSSVHQHELTEQAVYANVTLRESERRFREMIDALPAPVYTTDAEGRITHANPAAIECFGRTPQLETDRWCGCWKMFRLDGTPLPHDQCPMAIALREARAIRGEVVIVERPDGTRRWVEPSPTPLFDGQGRVVGGINMLMDVTSHIQAEAASQESELRYRRLFESSKDGILIVDASSRKITHVNPFLTKLLDYPPEHFLGKELWEIGFLRDKQASRAAMQRLDETGSLRYESLPLEDRHGILHPVELVANAYLEGQHPVIQCNIRDISERSVLERMLRGQAAELSDLHRRKDEFLAMLSHELRSPLAPIANAVQLLAMHQGDESRLHKQARGIIERQLGQLQHLVDDLLEVSRITSGRVQLLQSRVAISGIVHGALETVRPLIDQRRHSLTVSLPPQPIWLHADASRLEQILVNLLTNAAKFTEPEGQIWVNVQQEGDECVVRVRDSGVGIAPTLLPHIFDLFTQGERTLDRSQGGLGIGLALVQRLTELHGGTVEVSSELGRGSEFGVRLPVMPTETSQASPPVVESALPAARPLRVLVVDDNADTVLSLSLVLSESGHEVRSAHDGPSGVLAALEYLPDVALLDIGLPGLNGYGVAKRIRQEPALQDITLIALTGYGQDADRLTSQQAGFNHHLVKPADFVKLEQILATVSKRGSAH